MRATSKCPFILLFVSCLFVSLLAVEPYTSTSPKQSRELNQPEIVSTFRRFEECAPTLLKIIHIISEVVLTLVWMLDSCLSAFLWILNETVTSCTEFMFSIFGGLFHVVKLLEALGFGLKFLLEVNYFVVSYFFNTAGLLKENINHAVTLVKIILANETEHIYESSSMAWEGVQNLFLSACNHTWGSFALVWHKAGDLALWLIDNFTTHFGFPGMDFPLIVSTSVAAVKFFFESLVITAGVVSDGSMFLLKYIGNTVLGLGTKLSAKVCVICSATVEVVVMVAQHMIFLVSLPVSLLQSIISGTVSFLFAFWNTVVAQTAKLVKLIRGTILFVCHSLAEVTTNFVSSTLTFTNHYVPGGFAGFCIMVCISVGVVLWRRNILFLLRLAWASLRRISLETINHNTHDFDQSFEMESEEEIIEQNTEMEQQPEAEGSCKGSMSKAQQKLKYELEKERDKRLCIICQDNMKNILLLPCRHVCLCERCLHEIRHGRVQLVQCPLCRRHIQSTMEVFV